MQEKKTLRQTIIEMEPGQVMLFPANRVQSVTSTCSLIGFSEGRRYKTRRDTERGVLEVTRIS